MKILIISDKVTQGLYNTFIKKNKLLKNVGLILSAGDLPFYYYDFLVSNLNVPLYFIFGNHVREADEEFEHEPRSFNKMGGFFNLDNKVIRYNNLLIAGLEGSYKYNEKKHQYTEKQMRQKIRKLIPRLLLNKILYGRYLDILVTHAPPNGYYKVEKNDLAHYGFKAFNAFIKKYKPKYVVHGHIHLYGLNTRAIFQYKHTKIINAYGYKIIQLKKTGH